MALLKWNKDFALEQTADDLELLEELLDMFKSSFAADLELIREGVGNGDSTMVGGAAHSIKGAAASLGMESITDLVKKIESDCKAGKLDSARTLLPQLETMLREIEEM